MENRVLTALKTNQEITMTASLHSSLHHRFQEIPKQQGEAEPAQPASPPQSIITLAIEALLEKMALKFPGRKIKASRLQLIDFECQQLNYAQLGCKHLGELGKALLPGYYLLFKYGEGSYPVYVGERNLKVRCIGLKVKPLPKSIYISILNFAAARMGRSVELKEIVIHEVKKITWMRKNKIKYGYEVFAHLSGSIAPLFTERLKFSLDGALIPKSTS